MEGPSGGDSSMELLHAAGLSLSGVCPLLLVYQEAVHMAVILFTGAK